MGGEVKQAELLGKLMRMIIDSKVCPETPKYQWPKILLFAHARGYIYTNGDASAFALVYRIPEWEEKWSITMPDKESGNCAYVAFAVSESKDKLALTKMFKENVRRNNIEEMIYHRRNSDTDLKRIITRRSHVEVKVA